MSVHVAFLRAINVAGHACVRMADLKDAFMAAGCTSARTYIQSGNVIFAAPAAKTLTVERKIQAGVRELLGAEPTILFRTAEQLEAIVRADPFKTMSPTLGMKCYVTLLARAPEQIPPLPLVSAQEALEVVAMTHLDVFVVSGRKKNGSFGFPNAFIEKAIGVAATSRNWTTLTKIVELTRNPA